MKKLFELQNRLKAIKKEADNPFFGSKYFDINALLAELKPLLNEIGLVVLQPLQSVDGVNALKTVIIDVENGNVIVESSIALPTGVDPQKMGSAITYYRRYSLQSLLLLEAEDDDANIASDKNMPVAPLSRHGGDGNCQKCGAKMVMSKAGKIYCENTCWLPKTK